MFYVVLANDHEVLLHIEFQGPRTHRPMGWRMLDYMSRLAEREQTDLCSVVLYVGEGAGRDDEGQHQVTCPDGGPSLLWRYRVIRLWELPADALLDLARPALLPLIGQTQMAHPERIIPEVVQTIGRLTNTETQARLFTTLVNLMRDEEIIQMTEKLVQKMDRGLLTDTPYLRRVRQEAREEALAEASEELLAKQAEWSIKQREMPHPKKHNQVVTLLFKSAFIKQSQIAFIRVPFLPPDTHNTAYTNSPPPASMTWGS